MKNTFLRNGPRQFGPFQNWVEVSIKSLEEYVLRHMICLLLNQFINLHFSSIDQCSEIQIGGYTSTPVTMINHELQNRKIARVITVPLMRFSFSI